MTVPTSIGFSLSVPDSWFELDVKRSSRDANIKLLVESRVRDQPELWEHRAALIKVLRRQAREAAESGAIYCACFVIVLEESVIPGAVTVSIIPPPPGGTAVDAIAEHLPTREASEEDETWTSRSIVHLDGVGRVPRSEGVMDVELPDGSGTVRSLVMHTFVPLDSDRVLLVAAASPAVDLAEPLLELFDAVTGTLSLVSTPHQQSTAAVIEVATRHERFGPGEADVAAVD